MPGSKPGALPLGDTPTKLDGRVKHLMYGRGVDASGHDTVPLVGQLRLNRFGFLALPKLSEYAGARAGQLGISEISQPIQCVINLRIEVSNKVLEIVGEEITIISTNK